MDDINPNCNSVESTDRVADCDIVISTPKKEFVRPEISVPVDVLEATTFFQLADSGATN